MPHATSSSLSCCGWRGLVVAFALAAPLACSPAAAPALVASVTTAAPAALLPPAPDVSEVPVPPGLVASGRLSKPSASFATVRAWTQLPMPQSEQVTELVVSEPIGPVVDLDQPIDFAIAMTGSAGSVKELRAVSAAVKDPDKVKAALAERYKLVPGNNGVVIIQGLGRSQLGDGDADDVGKPDSGGEGGRACELAPAFGDAPVRLVCAWSPAALDELGPWLARSAPRAPSRADLQVDLRTAPVEPLIAERKRLLAVIFASVLAERLQMPGARDVLLGLGRDLTDFGSDLASVSLDLSLVETAARLKLTLQLRETTSTLARIATAHPERSGPAPAAFWPLPADANVAFFSRGIDEADLAKVRDPVLALVGEALADEGVKPADARPLVEGLGQLVSPAPLVYASGTDRAALRKAIDAERSGAADIAGARHEVLEAQLGWGVAGLDEPPTRLMGALKSLSTGLASPSIAAAYRSKTKDLVPPRLRPAPVPKAAGLPAASVHYVFELHARQPAGAAAQRSAAPRASPTQVHVLVVPDGQRTWVAFGGHEALVAGRLAVALGSGGDKLAARVDLAPLKAQPLGTAGFFTLRSLAQVTLPFQTGGASVLDEALPHQGLTPIFFSATSSGGLPATVEIGAELPRDAIEDVVSGIVQHGGF